MSRRYDEDVLMTVLHTCRNVSVNAAAGVIGCVHTEPKVHLRPVRSQG
jgi:hypothetical protein